MNERSIDFLLPPEMAVQAEQLGVSKANMPLLKTWVLSMLAGAFIALGAIFSTTVLSGSATLPYGLARLLGGISFSLGLILVIIGGAELFTGNNLIVMAWANKKVSTALLLRNWLIVYSGNFIGAVFMAVLMFVSGQHEFGGSMVGKQLMLIAKAKCELGFIQAMALGVLCNILVCLAVWLCFSARSTSAKILSIVFPVSAFVAAGFEHSVANMYYIPMALLLKEFAEPSFIQQLSQSGMSLDSINWSNFLLHNLLPVSLGNLIGGAFLVGGVYWFVYLRKAQA